MAHSHAVHLPLGALLSPCTTCVVLQVFDAAGVGAVLAEMLGTQKAERKRGGSTGRPLLSEQAERFAPGLHMVLCHTVHLPSVHC